MTILQEQKIRGNRTPKQRQRDLNARVRSSIYTQDGDFENGVTDKRTWDQMRQQAHLQTIVLDQQLGWTYASEEVHEYHVKMTEIEDTVTLQEYLQEASAGTIARHHIIDVIDNALVVHCH